MSDLDAVSLAAEEGEYLDSGYDRQTPDGDNLLLDFCRAEVAMWTSWGVAIGATSRVEDDGTAWVDAGSASVFGNPVLWTRPLDSEQTGAAITRQRTAFAERSGGPYLLYSAFPTTDLAPLGLQPVGHPPCMVLLPEVRSDAAHPGLAGLEVRRVQSREELKDFERTLIEAYPIPDLIPWRSEAFMGAGLIDDPRWHLFVGYAGHEAVATAAAFVTDHVIDVTLVTCRPGARGRGYGRAVTEAAVHASPTVPAMLLGSDDGRPLYKSMGFRTITRFSLWIGPREGQIS